MSGLSIDSRSAPRLPARYRLTGHIANGGMAAVWAADDLTLGRRVAIKVLASHLAEDPRNAKRFEREARAAARVSNHPHVVTIYDVDESEGRSFIVMELLAGGSVADAIRAAGPGRVDRGEALAWLRDAASALDAAHAEGIVHRDVKPANLLLSERRRAFVADFGIARMVTEVTMTSTGEMLGTAAYLSPEQALGEPASAASDRYALAVVAYELLTGTRPFTGEHFAAQARQHVETLPPEASSRAADLPPGMDPVLARGLAKEPDARWPTAGALVDALCEASGSAPEVVPADPTEATIRIAPRPPGPVAGPGPVPERRGGRFALLALAAVAAVIALVAVLSGGSDDKKPASSHRRARRAPSGSKGSRPASAPVTKPAPATKPASTPAPPPAPGSPGAAALQARGHALVASDPTGAVTVLRQAVTASGGTVASCRTPSTAACQTYAYALFDLGHALRLAGQPAAAIPILNQRAQIRDQTGTVLGELALARQAAAGGAPSAAPPRGKPGKGVGKAKGKKGD
jgi:serine/threonine-protein kinase